MPIPTDFVKLRNPYDFANPVQDPTVFSGREDELNDIRYYLDQGRLAASPINLALLGPRAAGKTSLLNMVHVEAAARGYCVARVDLNQSDVESQLAFLFKLFDSVLTAVVSMPAAGNSDVPSSASAFGGRRGRVYQAYLDMISAYDVPDEREWCPFIFPMQYAKAMAKGLQSVRISDQSFRADLRAISESLGKPIAILFDECNVLSESPVLLQMVRNIFMNTQGYMLVFTGTPDLFPVMDEVFSPIVRQFKKIDVGPFSRTEDTESCIKRPLASIGVDRAEAVFDQRTLRELRQIHDLTGGRPYEIQLLCHLMFKQLQLGRADRMRLSVSVLDDVLRELSRGRDIDARPKVALIRSLPREDLQYLADLTLCNRRATLEQLWFPLYCLLGRQPTRKAALQAALERFVASSILTVSDGIIAFDGDDFDRLYCKYYARQSSVVLELRDTGFQTLLGTSTNSLCRGLHLRMFTHDLLRAMRWGNAPQGGRQDGAAAVVVSTLDAVRRLAQLDTAVDACREFIDLASELYQLMLEMWLQGSRELKLIQLNVVPPPSSGGVALSFLTVVDPSEDMPEAERTALLNTVAGRANDLGGAVGISVEPVSLLSPKDIVSIVGTTGQPQLKARIAGRLADRAVEAYQRGLHSDALALAEVAASVTDDQPGHAWNNHGYLLVLGRRYDEAATMFVRALEAYGDGLERALPIYNLAMTAIARGDLRAALDYAREAASIAARRSSDDNQCLCLFVPRWNGGEFELAEVMNANLGTTSAAALAALEHPPGSE